MIRNGAQTLTRFIKSGKFQFGYLPIQETCQNYRVSRSKIHQRISRCFSTASPPKDNQADGTAPPQLLSKLFPQTSFAQDEAALKAEQKKEEEEEKQRQEKSKKQTKYGLYVLSGGLLGGLVWSVYELGTPERDENGQIIQDEFSKMPVIQQYPKRMWKSFTFFQKFIQEPSRDKLLPDPLKYPYIQPPYTLVLEMRDVLVHPDWTYKTGWRFKKRPGVDYFLEQLDGPFEIVIFTADQGVTVFPVLDALDPKGHIMYRLVRDATHFVDGHHVKNLDSLNRDLNKVIVIDWDANATKFHPRNTFNMERWAGNDDDTGLIDLVAFLKTVANAKVDDVREVLDYYRQFDNPLTQFRDNQRKLVEQMHERETAEQTAPTSPVRKWTPSFLGRR